MIDKLQNINQRAAWVSYFNTIVKNFNHWGSPIGSEILMNQRISDQFANSLNWVHWYLLPAHFLNFLINR